MAGSVTRSAACLRGRRVRVESAKGHRFEGYLDRVSMPDRNVLLRDVREIPGDARYPSAVVAGVDWVVPVTDEIHIRQVTPATVESSRFAVAEFDPIVHSQLIRDVARQGFVGSFPLVTESEGSLRTVDGHKRLWLAEQACLAAHPVVVEALSEWECAARFAFSHFPLPYDLPPAEDRANRFYADGDLRDSIEKYLDVFGDEALDIVPVEFNARRLGLIS